MNQNKHKEIIGYYDDGKKLYAMLTATDLCTIDWEYLRKTKLPRKKKKVIKKKSIFKLFYIESKK